MLVGAPIVGVPAVRNPVKGASTRLTNVPLWDTEKGIKPLPTPPGPFTETTPRAAEVVANPVILRMMFRIAVAVVPIVGVGHAAKA